MSQEFERILDRCLTEIQSGEATLESCLEAHSAYAQALAPLLSLAAHSHSLLSPDSPRPEFKRAAGIRISNTLKTRKQTAKPTRKRRSRIHWPILRPAYATIALILCVALLGSGFGVLRASADSLPGDRLYGVKRASERIQLVASLSQSNDAALLVAFANERLNEVEQLLALERFDDLELALTGLDSNLESLSELDQLPADNEPGSITRLEEKLAKHLKVLNQVLEQVPASAQPAIQKAIERSSHSQEVINQVKSDDHPSNAAPGQQKNEEEGNKPEDLPGRGKGRDKEKPEKTEKPK